MGRLRLPARRTSNPAEHRLSPGFGDALEVRGRLADGIVDVVAASSQRHVNGPDREAYSGPPLRLGEGDVGARNGVGLGFDPAEVRVPKHADSVVIAIALPQGRLARLVVDERQPALGQEGRERRERQDLGDDLEDVDERPPGGEVVEEPLGHLSMVVEGRVADPEDEALAVAAVRRG